MRLKGGDEKTMSKMKPYPFQQDILDEISGRTRCALYLDMG